MRTSQPRVDFGNNMDNTQTRPVWDGCGLRFHSPPVGPGTIPDGFFCAWSPPLTGMPTVERNHAGQQTKALHCRALTTGTRRIDGPRKGSGVPFGDGGLLSTGGPKLSKIILTIRHRPCFCRPQRGISAGEKGEVCLTFKGALWTAKF